MKSLKFKRISICSEREQKAFQLQFHEKKNLLVGENSTGKSTIVKSLFRAFDAEPTGDLRGWDYDAIVAVDFSVSNEQFTVLRKGDIRALFRGGQLIGAATRSSQWNDIFSEVVGFKLQLMDREERFRAASPSIFFIPFYINQDGSFFDKWNTFKNIQQFDSNAIPHALDYFSLVRPLKYFDLKGRERILGVKRSECEAEVGTLQRAIKRMRRSLKISPVKLSAKGFEVEVRELANQATDLGSKQGKIRRDIVETQELVAQLTDQIRLTNAALREHEADFKVVGIAETDSGAFRCPTCHAEHDSSFHTIFSLAEDAREVYRIREKLQSSLELVNAKLTRLQREAANLRQRYAEISSVLSVKRGRLTFEDVVKSHGLDSAETALNSELEAAHKELTKINSELGSIKFELQSILDSHDSDEPLRKFRANFSRFLVMAGVDPYPNIDTWKLSKRPSESGSSGPRAVIAYYGALWATMQVEGVMPSPLIIDSPNQNAQDKKNLEKLMALLASHTPADAQVIMCAEEVSDSFVPDQEVRLDRERALLRSEQMNEVSARLSPLIEAALSKLANID